MTLFATLLAAPLPGAPIPFETLAKLSAPVSALMTATAEAPAPAAYLPKSREVTNWRSEAARHLDLAPADRAKLDAGADPAGISRCVRLDNYWCIKKAGWAGEIAADSEGHVAFASSLEGATVAAVLLRRYYLDYGRKSALAIVSHWAPASCGATIARASGGRRGAAPRRVASAPDALSLHGVGNTLRARWLAGHRGGRARRVASAKTHTVVRARVADRVPDLMRAPSIMAGGGEAPVPLPTIRLASLGLGALPDLGPPPPPSAPTCAPDTARVHAYAAAVAKNVAPGPTDDLGLFEPDGRPGPNLAKVMLNMAAVEIGPRRVTPDLVEAAIAVAARSRTGRASAGDPKPRS